eukprot:gene57446-biopygen81336
MHSRLALCCWQSAGVVELSAPSPAGVPPSLPPVVRKGVSLVVALGHHFVLPFGAPIEWNFFTVAALLFLFASSFPGLTSAPAVALDPDLYPGRGDNRWPPPPQLVQQGHAHCGGPVLPGLDWRALCSAAPALQLFVLLWSDAFNGGHGVHSGN